MRDVLVVQVQEVRCAAFGLQDREMLGAQVSVVEFAGPVGEEK